MHSEDSGDDWPVHWLTCILCGSRGGSPAGKCDEADGGPQDESVRGSGEQRHARGMRLLLFWFQSASVGARALSMADAYLSTATKAVNRNFA